MVPPLHVLEQNGMRIETDHEKIKPLPPYAEELRELLLNFQGIIPLMQKANLVTLCEADHNIANNGFRLKEKIYRDSNHSAYQTRWGAAMALRSASKNLHGRDREPNWMHLMSGFVFENINHQSSEECILLRDMLCWGSDEVFTNAVRIRGMLSDRNPHSPKPDYWFGLRLYSDMQLSRLKGLELSDPGIKCFTQENLTSLREIYHRTFLHQPVSTKEEAGFPWMVVEVKKEGGNEEECLRQAANDCHTAIVFYEGLLKLASRDRTLEDSKPPIIALTAIGPKVKIFIAYKSETRRRRSGHRYRMSSIWEGNIEHILHAVQLRRIVDQLMVWALRIFKPWITRCLERWYEQASPDHSDEETDNDDSDSGERESAVEESGESEDESGDGSEEGGSDVEDGETDQTTPPSTPPKRRVKRPSSSCAARSRS